MFILNITEPVTLLLLLAATVLMIFLGKELKNPYVVIVPLAIFLILAVVYSIQLGFADLAEHRDVIFRSLAIDGVMILLNFFSYLWIDDIACRFYKKKSIDNSLDWFWRDI